MFSDQLRSDISDCPPFLGHMYSFASALGPLFYLRCGSHNSFRHFCDSREKLSDLTAASLEISEQIDSKIAQHRLIAL